MTFNELLKSAVGKHVKITMRGNTTLKGILHRYYEGEDFRGKFYSYAIEFKNGKIKHIDTTQVINAEVM